MKREEAREWKRTLIVQNNGLVRVKIAGVKIARVKSQGKDPSKTVNIDGQHRRTNKMGLCKYSIRFDLSKD